MRQHLETVYGQHTPGLHVKAFRSLHFDHVESPVMQLYGNKQKHYHAAFAAVGESMQKASQDAARDIASTPLLYALEKTAGATTIRVLNYVLKQLNKLASGAKDMIMDIIQSIRKNASALWKFLTNFLGERMSYALRFVLGESNEFFDTFRELGSALLYVAQKIAGVLTAVFGALLDLLHSILDRSLVAMYSLFDSVTHMTTTGEVADYLRQLVFFTMSIQQDRLEVAREKNPKALARFDGATVRRYGEIFKKTANVIDSANVGLTQSKLLEHATAFGKEIAAFVTLIYTKAKDWLTYLLKIVAPWISSILRNLESAAATLFNSLALFGPISGRLIGKWSALLQKEAQEQKRNSERMQKFQMASGQEPRANDRTGLRQALEILDKLARAENDATARRIIRHAFKWLDITAEGLYSERTGNISELAKQPGVSDDNLMSQSKRVASLAAEFYRYLDTEEDVPQELTDKIMDLMIERRGALGETYMYIDQMAFEKAEVLFSAAYLQLKLHITTLDVKSRDALMKFATPRPVNAGVTKKTAPVAKKTLDQLKEASVPDGTFRSFIENPSLCDNAQIVALIVYYDEQLKALEAIMEKTLAKAAKQKLMLRDSFRDWAEDLKAEVLKKYQNAEPSSASKKFMEFRTIDPNTLPELEKNFFIAYNNGMDFSKRLVMLREQVRKRGNTGRYVKLGLATVFLGVLGAVGWFWVYSPLILSRPAVKFWENDDSNPEANTETPGPEYDETSVPAADYTNMTNADQILDEQDRPNRQLRNQLLWNAFVYIHKNTKSQRAALAWAYSQTKTLLGFRGNPTADLAREAIGLGPPSTDLDYRTFWPYLDWVLNGNGFGRMFMLSAMTSYGLSVFNLANSLAEISYASWLFCTSLSNLIVDLIALSGVSWADTIERHARYHDRPIWGVVFKSLTGAGVSLLFNFVIIALRKTEMFVNFLGGSVGAITTMFGASAIVGLAGAFLGGGVEKVTGQLQGVHKLLAGAAGSVAKMRKEIYVSLNDVWLPTVFREGSQTAFVKWQSDSERIIQKVLKTIDDESLMRMIMKDQVQQEHNKPASSYSKPQQPSFSPYQSPQRTNSGRSPYFEDSDDDGFNY